MSDLLGLRLGPRRGCRRALGGLALYALGCELEGHDPEAAAEAYRKATLARPGLSDAHNNLGRLRHQAGRFAEAEACYRAAIAADDKRGLYHYNLGVALEDLSSPDAAKAAYEAALERDPTIAEAHFNLAGLLEKAGAIREAVRHLAQYRALRRVG